MSNHFKLHDPILVTGGAGYIGSHMAKLLKESGYTPIILDNLSTGLKCRNNNMIFIEGDINDIDLIVNIHQQYKFSSVMHFAAHIQVDESVLNPLKYYDNNVIGSLKLLEALQTLNVNKIVFSSSAAVYGEPRDNVLIKEDHPTFPVNPYGRTKLMIEHILRDCDMAYGLTYASLRYFNVAGMDKAINFGLSNAVVTHLIPLVMQAASGRKPSLAVYGDDYPTSDGTCIRDYIHVKDLCEAHLLALIALWENDKSFTFNLGTGQGFSVQEVINEAKRVTNKNIAVIRGNRRLGDPAQLVADGSLSQSMFNWKPQYSNLNQIIEDAWEYEQSIMKEVMA